MHSKELKSAIHATLRASEGVRTAHGMSKTISEETVQIACDEIKLELGHYNIPFSVENAENNKYWDIQMNEIPSAMNPAEREIVIRIVLMEKDIPILSVKYLPLENTLFFQNSAGTFRVDQVTLDNSYEVDLSAVKVDGAAIRLLERSV